MEDETCDHSQARGAEGAASNETLRKGDRRSPLSKDRACPLYQFPWFSGHTLNNDNNNKKFNCPKMLCSKVATASKIFIDYIFTEVGFLHKYCPFLVGRNVFLSFIYSLFTCLEFLAIQICLHFTLPKGFLWE